MKNIFGLMLLVLSISSRAFAVVEAPLYDRNAILNIWDGDVYRPKPCKDIDQVNGVYFCLTKDLYSAAEAKDLTELEQKIDASINQKLELTKTQFLLSQEVYSKAFLQSDELREAVRAIIREELKRIQDQ